MRGKWKGYACEIDRRSVRELVGRSENDDENGRGTVGLWIGGLGCGYEMVVRRYDGVDAVVDGVVDAVLTPREMQVCI